MTTLNKLIARRDRAAEKARNANAELHTAERTIREWGGDQIKAALAKKGITPGRSIVRMKVRKTRQGRIFMEEVECFLDGVGRVEPPTMDRGALGPNACSTDMWWCAYFNWRNVRKDGTPGATYDFCVIQGDTVADVVGRIELVRDLEITSTEMKGGDE